MPPLPSSWPGRLGFVLLLGALAGLGWRLAGPQGAPAAALPAPVAAPTQTAPAGIPLAGEDDLLAEVARQDWVVRRWRDYPAVLVIQFPALSAQGRALNRIAALLEKARGSRDHVLDDAELQALLDASGDSAASFFLGHDYDAERLARFFSLAQAQGIALNSDERRLRDLLLQADLIAADEQGSGYASTGAGALVSFSAPQPDDPATPADDGMDDTRRASVLRHELSHGRFFTDEAYREHCLQFWQQRLSDAERRLWRRHLAGLGYDRGNEELMANETQALLMHTPDERDFNAGSLGLTEPQLTAQRRRFLQAPGG